MTGRSLPQQRRPTSPSGLRSRAAGELGTASRAAPVRPFRLVGRPGVRRLSRHDHSFYQSDSTAAAAMAASDRINCRLAWPAASARSTSRRADTSAFAVCSNQPGTADSMACMTWSLSVTCNQHFTALQRRCHLCFAGADQHFRTHSRVDRRDRTRNLHGRNPPGSCRG